MILPEKILTDEEREDLIKEIMKTETVTAVDPKDPDKKSYSANNFGEYQKGEVLYSKTVLENWVNSDWKHIPAKLIHKIRTFGKNTEKSFDSIDEHIFILLIMACIALSFMNNQISHVIQVCIGSIVTYIITTSTISRIINRKTMLSEPEDKQEYNLFVYRADPKYKMVTEQNCITEKLRRDINNIQSKTNIGVTTRSSLYIINKKNNSFIENFFLCVGIVFVSQILMLPHNILMNELFKVSIENEIFNEIIGGVLTILTIYTYVEIDSKKVPFLKSKIEKILVKGTQRIQSEIPMYVYLIASFVTTILVVGSIKTIF